MKLDRSQRPLHIFWATPAVALVLLCTGWYFFASARAGNWLGGGSAAGLACGVAAALIILFEMLLWPRKELRRWRLFPVKHWMCAHIWFGLACVPLAICHSGFHGGGVLTWSLLIILGFTVLSGIYGLVMQNILPARMLQEIPAETIYSQIDHVSRQNVDDARQMLLRAVGPNPQRTRGSADRVQHSPGYELEVRQAAVIGAIRAEGRITGREVRTIQPDRQRTDAELLWNAFDEMRPFLLEGQRAGGPIATLASAEKWFDQLRQRCREESYSLIEALEAICDQRRQFDRQATLHGWLHGWLPLHVAISVALSLLLIWHVIIALRYW